MFIGIVNIETIYIRQGLPLSDHMLQIRGYQWGKR
jgi:hypothetical protein